jgi:hypothetical protein
MAFFLPIHSGSRRSNQRDPLSFLDYSSSHRLPESLAVDTVRPPPASQWDLDDDPETDIPSTEDFLRERSQRHNPQAPKGPQPRPSEVSTASSLSGYESEEQGIQRGNQGVRRAG